MKDLTDLRKLQQQLMDKYQFIKIGEAHKVRIKLNAKQYDLSPEAIAAFKRLGGLVNPLDAG